MTQGRVPHRRVRVRYFSWFEYFMVLIMLVVCSILPPLFYGADFSQFWNRYTGWFVVYWAILTAIFCGSVAYSRYRTFARPLRILSSATRRVAEGDFSVYVEPLHRPAKHNYMDVMFEDFNKMVAELGSIETLKNDFISNVSHEVKTPLAVIKNYTALLRRGGLSPETQQEYMDTIDTAADKLSVLVTNILRLNKLDNQEIELAPEPFDLCRQLCDCVFAVESLLEKKNLELEVQIEDKAVIRADEEMLGIVWNNLLSNALKFTEPGGRISLIQTSEETSVTVTLTDTGCGMSEETVKHIFDRFYQGDTSHSREGNGLGLTLAHRVIDRAGGTLTVKSELGKGSVFRVELQTGK